MTKPVKGEPEAATKRAGASLNGWGFGVAYPWSVYFYYALVSLAGINQLGLPHGEWLHAMVAEGI